MKNRKHTQKRRKTPKEISREESKNILNKLLKKEYKIKSKKEDTPRKQTLKNKTKDTQEKKTIKY